MTIILRAEEVKKLAEMIGDNDYVKIEEWSDFTNKCESQRYFHEITLIKNGKKH